MVEVKKEAVASPQPPRQSGNVKTDIDALYKWANDWFRTRVMRQRTTARVDAAAAVTPLEQVISASPTQAEVEAIQAKINELIQSLQ